MKKISIILCSLIIVFQLSACDQISKKDIITLVKNNESLIKDTVAEIEFHKQNLQYISTTEKSPYNTGDSDVNGLYTIALNSENRTFIHENSDNPVFESIMKLQIIKEINIDSNKIEFNCGGSGIVSSSTYYGFLYIKDENTLFIEHVGFTITKKDNGWLRMQDNSDNGSYFEKICENIYYYETFY